MHARPQARRLSSTPLIRTIGLTLLASASVAPLRAPPQTRPPAAETPPPTLSSSTPPIAIVPLDSRIPGSAAVVTGALQVTGGRALIAARGTGVSRGSTHEA